MHLLYNFGIRIYEFAIHISSLFNPKAKDWVSGRKNFFEHLPEVSKKKIYWFHCASLGEFDMALPVMNLFKERHPDIFILVTFFSPSGMSHFHKRKHQIDLALYLPSDTPGNAKKFISHFHPQKVFFVKYEFWSNYIFEAKKQNVQVLSICALFRREHRFFKWYGGFFRKTLKKIDFFYTQNETSSLLLADIGITNFITTGDTRFDRVIENKNQLEKNNRIEEFLGNEKAIIIGSSWSEDLKVVHQFIIDHPDLKFIIAPHNVNENQLIEIENLLKTKTQRYTEENKPEKNVLILNTIGNLANAYAYGKIAYVGGGFSGNLHNILEPAVFGLPVIFGPKFRRFPEATHFIHLGIGFSIKDEFEFKKAIEFIQINLAEISKKTKATVFKNTGASQKIVTHVEQNSNN